MKHNKLLKQDLQLNNQNKKLRIFTLVKIPPSLLVKRIS